MIYSFGLILILGLLSSYIFQKLKLPGLIGLIITGILIGPSVLDLLDDNLLNISADIRKIALLVILLRAGLGIKKKTLKKVGTKVLKLGSLPCLLEGFAIIIAASYILNIDKIEAGILAFILAAVSPAVVVPSMIKLIENKKGAVKGIPTLLLASTSIDDVFAITLFTAFTGLYFSKNSSIFLNILSIPLSIALGVLLGVIVAITILFVNKKFSISLNKAVILLLSSAILLTFIEEIFVNIIPIASLLGLMTLGFVILDKNKEFGEKLISKLNGIWVLVEILLFVLVGATVDVKVAISSGVVGLIIIAIGLLFRTIGVFISLIKSDFTFKEKLFCVSANIPKATVQAAIGSVPLAMGVEHGEIFLAISVLSILVTAPLGAILIKYGGNKWLT